MHIYGLQKTTLLDFPGHVACTIFLGGCNFRCPFCQNRDIVLPNNITAAKIESTDCKASLKSSYISQKASINPQKTATISEETLIRFLQKRQNILEGICITGGEPTLSPDLGEWIDRFHSMGYLVKLDTNGYLPDALRRLLGRHGPDYIAMDIKAAPSRYACASGVAQVDMNRIEESVRLIRQSGIPYEFRTTTARELQSMEDFAVIGKWLAGSQAYYLQSYRDCETLSGLHFTPYTEAELNAAAEILRKFIPNTFLRGI